jgi:LCP family protein required for cell wall assembly
MSAPHHAKINEAFAIGGASGEVAEAAACTIRTVEDGTGLRIDHFASVDFQGFKGMVNALGGIEVCPEQAIHDEKAHPDLEAGCQTVRDEEALGCVRARYSIGDGSDTGRIGRQQEFMQALAVLSAAERQWDGFLRQGREHDADQHSGAGQDRGRAQMPQGAPPLGSADVRHRYSSSHR